MNAPLTDLANDACWLVSYTAGAMLTDGRYHSTIAARRACGDVGRWYPIDAGFRSEDGRTLILRDAAEKHWDCAKSAASELTARQMQAWLASHPATRMALEPVDA